MAENIPLQPDADNADVGKVMNTIALKNLTLTYNKKPLFHNLHHTFKENKITCILGPSGVGKSTLLRAVAGLESKCQGEIDLNLNDMSYMSQDDCLMPWLNIINNVTILEKCLGDKPDKAHAKTLLEQLGLKGYSSAKPNELSGGMRQRAVLARILYEDRSIILMDEPFSALDAITRYQMQNLLIDIFDNRTILFITHDPLEALRLGDVVLTMEGQPASLSCFAELDFPKPRDIHNPKLQALHAELLGKLTEAKAVTW